MKPVINVDVCVGCGTCEGVCSTVFKMVDGKATVLEADYEANKAGIDDAINACGVSAISWGE